MYLDMTGGSNYLLIDESLIELLKKFLKYFDEEHISRVLAD